MLRDWIEYGGIEIANTARTIHYAEQFGLGWFKGCTDCGDVGDALIALTGQTYREVRDTDGPNPPAARTYDDLLHSGPGGSEIQYGQLRDLPSGAYQSPQRDKPPWFDIDNADTWGFLGFYPLEITGGSDSTREVFARERVKDGTAIGRMRHAGRTIYVRGLLVGIDDNSVQAGMSWLRYVTKEPLCSTPDPCERPALRMFAACPVLCDDAPNCLDYCALPYIREFYDVVVDEGPRVIQELGVRDGACWEVEFIMTAGVPFAYGRERVVVGEEAPLVAQFATFTEPAPKVGNVDCHVDPDCAAVPVFPGYPSIDIGCHTKHTGPWKRVTIPVEAAEVPEWAVAVPVVTLRAATDLRDVRLRWYDSPTPDAGLRNTMYVTWLPANGTMLLDGARQRTTLDCNGTRRRVEHLVESEYDSAVKWPMLSCGHTWTLTVDVPDSVNTDDIDVQLSLRVRDG